jgi:tetratricopeptide (TPR) repeat protein
MRFVPRTRAPHIDDPKKFGPRLREARLAAGVSQRQLALAGCTAAYVSRIEAGERQPSLQLIHAFARRLRVSPEYLTTGVHADSGPSDLVEAEVALRLGEVEEAGRMFRERLEEDPASPQALAGLGRIAFGEDDLVTAIDLLEQALASRRGHCLEDAGAVEALARAYATTGALEAAVALLDRAAQEATEAGALVETVRFQVLLANALIDSGAVNRAEQVLAETIGSVESLRDPLAVARVYWTQGRLHTHHKDAAVGARYARRALEILERTEDERYIAMAYQFLAVAENTAGSPEEALRHLARGRSLFGVMLPREDAMFAIEETRALLALDRTQEAAKVASVALGKLQALEPGDQGRAYILLGEVFHRSGDRERAIELLELAVELLEEFGKPYVLDAASKLSDVLEEVGRSDQALAVLRRAVAAGKSESRVAT